MIPVLLDTCAMIWLAEGAKLSKDAIACLSEEAVKGRALFVSPITCWEVGQLNARGRLRLTQPPLAWFKAFLSQPLVELAALPLEALAEAPCLPGAPPKDPADRIIIATARHHGYRIMTRDRLVLDYAALGHVAAVRC